MIRVLGLASMVLFGSAMPGLALEACGQGRWPQSCVIDGDTLCINGKRLRAAGYDAPETRRNICGGAQEVALGRTATARLVLHLPQKGRPGCSDVGAHISCAHWRPLGMHMQSLHRKPTNLTLDPGLLTEARSLGVNLSQAAEAGVRKAVADAKAEAWQRENAAALASSNNWVDRHGLPLDRYRQF